jgi:hypothetical protein
LVMFFSFLFWVWGFCIFMFGYSSILSGDYIMKFVKYIIYVISHIYKWEITFENWTF